MFRNLAAQEDTRTTITHIDSLSPFIQAYDHVDQTLREHARNPYLTEETVAELNDSLQQLALSLVKATQSGPHWVVKAE